MPHKQYVVEVLVHFTYYGLKYQDSSSPHLTTLIGASEVVLKHNVTWLPNLVMKIQAVPLVVRIHSYKQFYNYSVWFNFYSFISDTFSSFFVYNLNQNIVHLQSSWRFD